MVSIVALAIGVISMLNTMVMSVLERTHEIGILRAVGWPRGRVVKMVLGEIRTACLCRGQKTEDRRQNNRLHPVSLSSRGTVFAVHQPNNLYFFLERQPPAAARPSVFCPLSSVL
jgi:hypothetical protein